MVKIHKKGSAVVAFTASFGQVRRVPAPKCAGVQGLWRGNTYLVTWFWKNVTCKNCLKARK